jgi:hypothetical protein
MPAKMPLLLASAARHVERLVVADRPDVVALAASQCGCTMPAQPCIAKAPLRPP